MEFKIPSPGEILAEELERVECVFQIFPRDKAIDIYDECARECKSSDKEADKDT